MIILSFDGHCQVCEQRDSEWCKVQYMLHFNILSVDAENIEI